VQDHSDGTWLEQLVRALTEEARRLTELSEGHREAVAMAKSLPSAEELVRTCEEALRAARHFEQQWRESMGS